MRRCGNRARLRIFRLESSSRLTMDRRLKSTLVLVAAILGFPALAQGQPAPPRPSPSPANQATAVTVPATRIAVIYSQYFQDPKTGIARFTALLTKLNGEFQKTQDDLNPKSFADLNPGQDRSVGSAEARLPEARRRRAGCISKAPRGIVHSAARRYQQSAGCLCQNARHHDDFGWFDHAVGLRVRGIGHYRGVHRGL